MSDANVAGSSPGALHPAGHAGSVVGRAAVAGQLGTLHWAGFAGSVAATAAVAGSSPGALHRAAGGAGSVIVECASGWMVRGGADAPFSVAPRLTQQPWVAVWAGDLWTPAASPGSVWPPVEAT